MPVVENTEKAESALARPLLEVYVHLRDTPSKQAFISTTVSAAAAQGFQAIVYVSS